jgi:hydrogenase expression/formation protein HypE
MSHDLIHAIFLSRFSNSILDANNDAGVFSLNQINLSNSSDDIKLAVSTDSHVVWPLTFPGGDIGRLAICGSINDVSMMGAQPIYITVGFILEEGLEISLLEKISTSMQEAAKEAGVQIIAGDTKVVQRGKADEM